ncbi:hypothetical protein [Rheinheimera aquimaris]|jgi:hypothetical protein|uniref:hypothetical protein n=1 Tax=Rheinheimera aquimaris TaxID=412437 RepID=UPI001E42A467|nr:hypothetical protein [Rheinheimera aquimaris]MCD1600034.1 hypothetical protein [Rheinheimera aquimaris]
MHLISIDKLKETDIDELPGVYTFYYTPTIQPYDLYKEDDAKGADALISLIDKKFIKTYLGKQSETSIKLGYEQRLRGELRIENKSVREKKFSNRIEQYDFFASELFQSYKAREAFKRVMSEIGPMFSSPIYVGVSHNLRERVFQHRDSYYEALDLKKRNIEITSKDFGTKAAFIGKGSEISVGVNYISSNDHDISKSNAYMLSILVEWVIQQQTKPILGEI